MDGRAGYPSKPPLGPEAPRPARPAPPPPEFGPPPPPPPLPPPPPVATKPASRQVVFGVLLALVLASSTVLIGLTTGDDDKDHGTEAASATTEPDDPPATNESPSTTEPKEEPSGPPTEDELDDMVEDISAFVEEERGLTFKEPVNVELEDDTAFEDRLLEGVAEAEADFVEVETLYKAFGLIDSDDTMLDITTELVGGGVVGFYDPTTAELVIRATELTPFARVVIAHELVHALDDQHFNLDRPEYDEADDEIGFGFTALIEGNASYIEDRYYESELSGDEQVEADDEELNIGLDLSLPDVSFALLDMFNAPYVYGPELIGAIVDESGTEGVDAAMADPPQTSEQVVEPDAYLEREAAVEVERPSPDSELVSDGVLGQLFMQSVLADVVDLDAAVGAGDGWGGDWAVSWNGDGRSCVRMTMVGDTVADSDELHQAWTDWAAGGDVDASVEQSAPGQPSTLTTCSV